MDQQQDSFISIGGNDRNEETKESESVIFFRNRPHYDRYREEYDDDPEEGAPATSSFAYFSENEDDSDDDDGGWGRRPTAAVPPYLTPSNRHSQLVPPASFDVSEASTIIVKEDNKTKGQSTIKDPYENPTGEQDRSRLRRPARESVPVVFDQTVVVLNDPSPSFDAQSQSVALERSRVETSTQSGSFVDGKPAGRCSWVLLTLALAVVLLGGGGGAGLLLHFSRTGESVMTETNETMSIAPTAVEPTLPPQPTPPVAAPILMNPIPPVMLSMTAAPASPEKAPLPVAASTSRPALSPTVAPIKQSHGNTDSEAGMDGTEQGGDASDSGRIDIDEVPNFQNLTP